MAFQSSVQYKPQSQGSPMGQAQSSQGSPQAGPGGSAPAGGSLNQATDQGTYGGWSSAGQDMQRGLGFAEGTPGARDGYMGNIGSGSFDNGWPGQQGGSFLSAMGGFGKNMSPLMSQLIQRMQSGQGGTMNAAGMPPMKSFPNLGDMFQRPGNTGIAGGMGMPKFPGFGGGISDPYGPYGSEGPGGFTGHAQDADWGQIKMIPQAPGTPAPAQNLPQPQMPQFDMSKLQDMRKMF